MEGIKTQNETFEKSHIPSCRIVAEKEDNIYGWAALSLVSNRNAGIE